MADLIIIGAGQASIFAAQELSRSKADILVIDQEKDVSDRVCPVKKKYHSLHYPSLHCDSGCRPVQSIVTAAATGILAELGMASALTEKI